MIFQAGQWRGEGKASIMADNANRLGWTAVENTRLSDDEFDAALCALTGVADAPFQLRGDHLDAEITRRIQVRIATSEAFRAPPSYVLLEHLPLLQVTLNRQKWNG
jgi:hypothetical protein